MAYTEEHSIDFNRYYGNKESENKTVRKQKKLEELHAEVKKFVAMSSLLIGADKIRKILRELDE